jgi:hypothetical protein
MAARTRAPGSAVCCLSPETAMGQETTTKQRALQTFAFRCFFSLLSEEKIPQDIQRALMSSSAGACQSPDQRSREFKDHRRQADAWIGCDRGMGTNPCRETLPRRKYIGRLNSVQNRSWKKAPVAALRQAASSRMGFRISDSNSVANVLETASHSTACRSGIR